ncbi:MAG: 5'-deoxynucleotidase, partial [Lachnospiraceae bacterium]|nr:5'-deoxynucleotidase [Lachnospiraceae bacterium]
KAAQSLLRRLPEDMRPDYESLFLPREEDAYLLLLVKAADKLSALIKCKEEAKAGNREFLHAEASIRSNLEQMQLPELEIFMEEFWEAYSLSLDELGDSL